MVKIKNNKNKKNNVPSGRSRDNQIARVEVNWVLLKISLLGGISYIQSLPHHEMGCRALCEGH